jgi:hypothetical protein
MLTIASIISSHSLEPSSDEQAFFGTRQEKPMGERDQSRRLSK